MPGWLIIFLFPFLALISAKSAAAETSREVLFVSGDPAPMAGPGFTWTSLYTAYLDSEGTLAIDGQVAAPETGAHSNVVVIGPSAGPFQRLVGVGDTLPGTYFGGPVTLRSLGAYGALGGRVLLNATLAGGGVGSSNDQAILVADSQGLRMVAREGGSLPGLNTPIVEFFGSRRLDHDGGVTFAVRGTDSSKWYIYRGELGDRPQLLGESPRPQILLGSRSGFVVVSAGGSARKFDATGVSVVAEAGQPAPGLPEGWVLTPSDSNSCNDAGQILFEGVARNASLPTGQNSRGGLWLRSGNGDIELIALKPPNGDGMSSAAFMHSAVNAAGDVAYVLADSLYIKRYGRPVQLVAKSYMAMPPSANGATLGALDNYGLQLSANGNLVFASTTGLWVFTSDNQLKQIIRHGETIQHNGADYRVTDTDLLGSGVGGQEGRRRMLSDRGHIAFTVDLQAPGSTETRSAIVKVVLPNNGDPGQAPVANTDVITFRSGPGVPVSIPVLANDADPNGDAIAIHSVTAPRTGSVTIQGGQLRYVPKPEFNQEDRFTYTIRDTDKNYSVAEVVVRNPFRSLRGSYTTFVREHVTSVGIAKVSLSAAGQVSGRLKINGQTYLIRGTLRDDGSFAQAVAGIFTITFRVTEDGEGNPTLRGDVQTTTGTYTISDTTVTGLPPNISPQRITAQFRSIPDPETATPDFDSMGFATGKITKTGSVIFTGRLPDNRAFTGSAAVKRDGTIILSTAPYGPARGTLEGVFAFTGSTEGIDQWRATLRWQRTSKDLPESAIDIFVDGSVATYQPGATWPVIDYTFGWPADFLATWNGQTFVEFLEFDMGRAYVLEPKEGAMKLHINRNTGLVTGNFPSDSANKARQPFFGALFGARREAAGIIPTGNSCGSFTLTEPQ